MPDDIASIDGLLDRLAAKSVDGYWNPYTAFDWPERLEPEGWWMNPELMSVHGTAVFDELDTPTLQRLSKWESINFYSLNVHGIREVMTEVSERIHTEKYKFASEFLHHLLGEENEHMWFFAKFCQLYAGKIYDDRSMPMGGDEDGEVKDLLLFVTTVIFEELVDYFNARIGKNPDLPEIVRQINWKHHLDESRHVAFGRGIVTHLHSELLEARGHDPALKQRIDGYVRAFMARSIDLLYQPAVYADAGLAQPFKLRNRLRNDPARAAYHRRFLKRTTGFFLNQGIITREPFDA